MDKNNANIDWRAALFSASLIIGGAVLERQTGWVSKATQSVLEKGQCGADWFVHGINNGNAAFSCEDKD